MGLGGSGLPSLVNQDVRTGMAQDAVQQNAARVVQVTPGQVTPGDTQVMQAVEPFSQPGELFNYQYRFKMDNKLKRPVVQVIDKATGAELFEIPPEMVVKMLDALMSTKDRGALVDRKV